MFRSFLKYFFHYIVHAKSRQKLLLLAVVGLVLSSFALLVLQSTMGGLQNNLITRSKNISGLAEIELFDESETFSQELLTQLKSYGVEAYAEYEIELLGRYKNYIAPVIAHGVQVSEKERPDFLKGLNLEEAIVGQDLLTKLAASEGGGLTLISPNHVDSFMGDIPRSLSIFVTDSLLTDVPEIDGLHLWLPLYLIQNLIRKKATNKIRVYTPIPVKNWAKKYEGKLRYISWEERNKTLVWALNLETTVMLFLFMAMSLLVSLCITSGLLIFFGKIHIDLASFWILGASKRSLEKSSSLFLQLVSVGAVTVGIVLGLIFLWLFDLYGPEIMPDVFVDRKIPIFITTKGILLSFFIPYLISSLFSYISLLQFKKESNYLESVRSIGS